MLESGLRMHTAANLGDLLGIPPGTIEAIFEPPPAAPPAPPSPPVDPLEVAIARLSAYGGTVLSQEQCSALLGYIEAISTRAFPGVSAEIAPMREVPAGPVDWVASAEAAWRVVGEVAEKSPSAVLAALSSVACKALVLSRADRIESGEAGELATLRDKCGALSAALEDLRESSRAAVGDRDEKIEALTLQVEAAEVDYQSLESECKSLRVMEAEACKAGMAERHEKERYADRLAVLEGELAEVRARESAAEVRAQEAEERAAYLQGMADSAAENIRLVNDANAHLREQLAAEGGGPIVGKGELGGGLVVMGERSISMAGGGAVGRVVGGGLRGVAAGSALEPRRGRCGLAGCPCGEVGEIPSFEPAPAPVEPHDGPHCCPCGSCVDARDRGRVVLSFPVGTSLGEVLGFDLGERVSPLGWH